LIEINTIEKKVIRKQDLAYLILGVQPRTDLSKVRKIRRKLILKYHPDKWQNDTEEKKLAEILTGKINDAYDLIAPKKPRA